MRLIDVFEGLSHFIWGAIILLTVQLNPSFVRLIIKVRPMCLRRSYNHRQGLSIIHLNSHAGVLHHALLLLMTVLVTDLLNLFFDESFSYLFDHVCLFQEISCSEILGFITWPCYLRDSNSVIKWGQLLLVNLETIIELIIY